VASDGKLVPLPPRTVSPLLSFISPSAGNVKLPSLSNLQLLLLELIFTFPDDPEDPNEFPAVRLTSPPL